MINILFAAQAGAAAPLTFHLSSEFTAVLKGWQEFDAIRDEYLRQGLAKEAEALDREIMQCKPGGCITVKEEVFEAVTHKPKPFWWQRALDRIEKVIGAKE